MAVLLLLVMAARASCSSPSAVCSSPWSRSSRHAMRPPPAGGATGRCTTPMLRGVCYQVRRMHLVQMEVKRRGETF